MILECSKKDISSVIEYIGDEKLQCFYLYMDLLTIGIDNKNYRLWKIINNGEICCIAYQYYDCLHIFSKQEKCCDELIELIDNINLKVITGQEPVIKQIMLILENKGSKFKYEENHTITISKLLPENNEIEINSANINDLEEIVNLLLKSEVYSKVYSYESLYKTMKERMISNNSRVLIIRNDEGKIIATTSTNIETSELAVIGGNMVDPSMRRKGLSSAITSKIWNDVKREGKTGLAFLTKGNNAVIAMHKKMGYDFIGISTRIIID